MSKIAVVYWSGTGNTEVVGYLARGEASPALDGEQCAKCRERDVDIEPGVVAAPPQPAHEGAIQISDVLDCATVLIF